MSHRHLVSLAVTFALSIGCSTPPPEDGEAHERSGGDKLLIPSATSHEHGVVGGAYFRGQPYVTYMGTDARLNVVRRKSDGTWDTPTIFPDRGVFGGSLLANGGLLVLAFYNPRKEFEMWKSFDGKNFQRSARFNINGSGEQTVYGKPALVLHSGLVQAYLAYGPTNEIPSEWDRLGRIQQLVELQDGNFVFSESWSAKTKNPSAAVVNDDLHVVWNDTGFSRRYQRSWLMAQRSWSPITFHDAFHDGQAFAGRTADGVERLFWAYRKSAGAGTHEIKFAGIGWFLDVTTTHTSDRTPFGLLADRNVIEWAHIGRDGARSLNFNSVNF